MAKELEAAASPTSVLPKKIEELGLKSSSNHNRMKKKTGRTTRSVSRSFSNSQHGRCRSSRGVRRTNSSDRVNQLRATRSLRSESGDGGSLRRTKSSDSLTRMRASRSSGLPTSRRHVSFRVNEFDDVVADIHYIEKPSKQAISHLFYSDDEMIDIVQDARFYGERIRKFCPEISQLLECLFDEATAENLNDVDMSVIGMWAASKGRGLEDCMTRHLKTSREAARTRTINFYDQQLIIGSTNKVQNEKALRNHYLSESRRAREFAYIMAIGDEMEAQKHHREKPNEKRRLSVSKPKRVECV